MRDQRGSVVMLVPAGVLVMVVLGSIALDFSIAFMAERVLAAAAAAAANDAAGAIDEARFRRTGEIRLDAREARAAALAALRRRSSAFDLDPTIRIRGRQVEVVLRSRARFVFARAIPGAPRSTAIEARAEATAETRG